MATKIQAGPIKPMMLGRQVRRDEKAARNQAVKDWFVERVRNPARTVQAVTLVVAVFVGAFLLIVRGDEFTQSGIVATAILIIHLVSVGGAAVMATIEKQRPVIRWIIFIVPALVILWLIPIDVRLFELTATGAAAWVMVILGAFSTPIVYSLGAFMLYPSISVETREKIKTLKRNIAKMTRRLEDYEFDARKLNASSSEHENVQEAKRQIVELTTEVTTLRAEAADTSSKVVAGIFLMLAAVIFLSSLVYGGAA